MTNEIHQPFIYSTLDWTDSEAPVDITFLVMAVISVVITLSWCVSARHHFAKALLNA